MNSTAPFLLSNGPSGHPIGETSVAIVRIRRRHATPTLVRAALAMNSTAPFLLSNGPPGLPICETILAIVGVCGCWGLRGRRRWEWCWGDCDRGLRQGCGRATPAHSRAAIVLLRLGPRPLDEHITTRGVAEWVAAWAV